MAEGVRIGYSVTVPLELYSLATSKDSYDYKTHHRISKCNFFGGIGNDLGKDIPHASYLLLG